MRPAAIDKAAPMAAQADERECSREAVMDHGGGLLRIHYTDTGDSAPHAPVVALLHGSGPGTTGWSAFALQRPALRDAGAVERLNVLGPPPELDQPDTVHGVDQQFGGRPLVGVAVEPRP